MHCELPLWAETFTTKSNNNRLLNNFIALRK